MQVTSTRLVSIDELSLGHRRIHLAFIEADAPHITATAGAVHDARQGNVAYRRELNHRAAPGQEAEEQHGFLLRDQGGRASLAVKAAEGHEERCPVQTTQDEDSRVQAISRQEGKSEGSASAQ